MESEESINNLHKGQLQIKDSNHILYQLMVQVDGEKVVNVDYIDKNGHSLNQVWWNNLSDDWKDSMLFNIDIATKLEDKDKYFILLTCEKNYGRIIGKEYVKLQNYNIEDILEKIRRLDKFFLHNSLKFSMGLKPLSKLQNLKLLKISSVCSDFNSISKLSNLTTLEIGHNLVNLAQLTKLKKLKSLTILHNEPNLEPPEELIKSIKANDGIIDITDDNNRPF